MSEIKQPRSARLRDEFVRCYGDGSYLTRIEEAGDIRFARWDNQSRDGKKHQIRGGAKMKPWDGASDVREHLVDDVCNSTVDLLVTAFWSARQQAEPITAGTLTALKAAELRQLRRYLLKGFSRKELRRSVEEVAQMQALIGLAVVGIGWKTTTRVKKLKMTMEEVVQVGQMSQEKLMQGGPPEGGTLTGMGMPPEGGTLTGQEQTMIELPMLIQDPTREDEASELFVGMFSGVKKRTAGRCVRELREKGETVVPIVIPGRSGPEVRVLQPFRDILWSIETAKGLQNAPMIFEIRRMTETQVDVEGAENEWDADFVKTVKGLKGYTYGVQGQGTAFSANSVQDPNNELIELVWCYERVADADGIPGIKLTLFSPHMSDDQVGFEEELETVDNAFPFIEFQAEFAGDRLTDSRGVPDVLDAKQAHIKTHLDDVTNYQQLAIGRPLIGQAMKGADKPTLAPFGVVHEGRSNQWRWMDDMGGQPQLSVGLVQQERMAALDLYGLLATNPGKANQRQQRMADNWLMAWDEVFDAMVGLCYANWEPAKMEMILGRPAMLSVDEVAEHLVCLWFDVRSLDSEWVLKLLTAINQFVVPLDAGGTVDRNKLVRFVMSYLEPTLAEEVLMPVQSASQAMYEQVKADVLQMAAGNEANYVQNDPAAQTKLQYVQQVIAANPKYQQLLQADERFKVLLEKYAANLQQSVAQEQNKMVGRIGVKPEGMVGS